MDHREGWLLPILSTFERAAKNFLTARKDGRFADVAQRQRNALVMRRLSVRIRSSAPFAGGSSPVESGTHKPQCRPLRSVDISVFLRIQEQYSGEQRPDRQSDKRVNDTHETTAKLIGRAERGFFQQSC